MTILAVNDLRGSADAIFSKTETSDVKVKAVIDNAWTLEKSLLEHNGKSSRAIASVGKLLTPPKSILIAPKPKFDPNSLKRDKKTGNANEKTAGLVVNGQQANNGKQINTNDHQKHVEFGPDSPVTIDSFITNIDGEEYEVIDENEPEMLSHEEATQNPIKVCLTILH